MYVNFCSPLVFGSREAQNENDKDKDRRTRILRFTCLLKLENMLTSGCKPKETKQVFVRIEPGHTAILGSLLHQKNICNCGAVSCALFHLLVAKRNISILKLFLTTVSVSSVSGLDKTTSFSSLTAYLK